MNQFKKIKNMQTLYSFANRKGIPKQSEINDAVLNKFQEMVDKCAIIHDRTLRSWAMEAKRTVDPADQLKFKASASWVTKFKQRNRIVSRAITHKVSRATRNNDEQLRVTADDFVSSVRAQINELNLLPKHLFNADQSRFDKELHSHRTLRPKGISPVKAVVGSVSATTHSYMIMPVITADGEILKPTYVLVSEGNGKFPNNKPADPPNIISFAGRTANMSKAQLSEFYEKVFWKSIPEDRRDVFLLLDSWTPNKDDVLSGLFSPDTVSFKKRLIPAGCTGLIQPLDVYFFRPYKNFIKYVTDTIVLSRDTNIWHRDKFLALQSFTLYQFSAPLFRNMIRFAFHKAGYLDEEPEAFQTPIQYCFDSLTTDCCSQCEVIAVVRCAHCTQCFCLDHSILVSLHINCCL